MMPAPVDYDLVIAGAGFAGGILALAAARQGWRVALADPRPAEGVRDGRHLALAWDNCRYLATLGLWGELQPAAAPVRRVQVSQQGGLGTLWLESQPLGVDALGYVLPATALLRALATRLQPAVGVQRWHQTQITQVWSDTPQVRVSVLTPDGPGTWTARLVIAADGADSSLRAQAHLASQQQDYGQTALLASVSLTQDLAGVAYERFLRAGAIALLPLPTPGQASVIWSAPSAEAAVLQTLDAGAWLEQLQAALGQRVLLTGLTAPRQRYPLSLRWAPRQVQRRLLLLGNAAHTLHPLAAQGLNLILRDIMALTRLLETATDPGAADLLARYQAQRHWPQRLTLGLTDALARGVGAAWSAPLRSLALNGLALLPQRHWLATVAGVPALPVHG